TRKGWMSGNMAQLTVLLTGLALAATAYAILNLLIEQMVAEQQERLIQDTHQSVVEKLGGLEESITVIAALAGQPGGGGGQDFTRRVADTVPGIVHFDRV